MNRQEKLIVAFLFAVMLVWVFLYRPRGRVRQVPEPTEPAPAEAALPPESEPAARVPAGALPEPEPETADAPPEIRSEPSEPRADEQRIVLSNDHIRVMLSSWGAAVVSAELTEYPATRNRDSGPVRLDLGSGPALSLTGLPGLSTNCDYAVSGGDGGSAVTFTRTTSEGLRLERRIALGRGTVLNVRDVFSHERAGTVPLPAYGVAAGPMQMIASRASTRGVSYLGLDALPEQGGAGVVHWGKKVVPSLFGPRPSMLSCARADTSHMPERVSHHTGVAAAWAASKNKFFVQILSVKGGSSDVVLHAVRNTEASRGLVVSGVAAEMILAETFVEPGDALVREMTYYVGPKDYSVLKELGQHRQAVMELGWRGGFFGWMGAILMWLCPALLWMLKALYAVIPNYGVAIILLTLIVKIVFWPVTHKSTESMKKMQKIQPLVSELRAKYRDKPQRMNQEIMALYKEHKVNPMAGCLPVLIQIPVFIALFTVLRSAVELRFAGFLWIRDLSEPEGLLADVLPIPLNILPLFMTATTVLQQKLTPTAGDPQQQKMMALMPVVFLFIFYNMPSALVLYWSTNQCLSIGQLLLQRRRTAPGAEG